MKDLSEYCELTIPKMLYDNGTISVKMRAGATAQDDFLRFDAYPQRDPEWGRRHYGYVDVRLDKADDFDIRVDRNACSVNGKSAQTFTNGDFKESGWCIWHVSYWSREKDGSTPEMLAIKTFILYWAPGNVIPASEDVLDSSLVPYYYERPMALLDLAKAELAAHGAVRALVLIMNALRLRPDKKREILGHIRNDICGHEGERESEAAGLLEAFRAVYYKKGRVPEEELLDIHGRGSRAKKYLARNLLVDAYLLAGRDEKALELFRVNSMQCVRPYTLLMLGHNTDPENTKRVVRPCCPWLMPVHNLDLDEVLSVDGTWNSPEMATARFDTHRPRADQMSGGCRLCFEQGSLGDFDVLGFAYIDEALQNFNTTRIQINNLKRLVRHFLRGDARLNAHPMRYSLSFGSACNLRCKMCSAKWTGYVSGHNVQSGQLCDVRKHLRYANSVSVVGGEPLFIPSVIDFLHHVANTSKLNRSLNIEITTNGILLDKHLDLLWRIRHVSINISMDGCGDFYEEIRKGGKWRHLDDNISRMLEIMASKNLPWEVSASVVLMKTSVLGLDSFVDWICRKNADFSPMAPAKVSPPTPIMDAIGNFLMKSGLRKRTCAPSGRPPISLRFTPLLIDPRYPLDDEDLLGNASLREQIPDLFGILDRNCKKLDAHGLDSGQLAYYAKILKSGYRDAYSVKKGDV